MVDEALLVDSETDKYNRTEFFAINWSEEAHMADISHS